VIEGAALSGRIGRHALRVSSVLGLVVAALFVPPAAAKRIHRTAPTHIALSATRSADGTITAQAKLTSPDPHCLVKDRVKKLSDGYYHVFGAALFYGGPWGLGPYGADGTGEPPDLGWLAPVSSGGRSPWLWKATWPGDAEVRVENQNPNSTQPFKYVSTVGASSAVGLGGSIENGNNPLNPVYKAKYNQGGNRIIVRCLRKHTAKTFPF
jgi:hypothetical protein